MFLLLHGLSGTTVYDAYEFGNLYGNLRVRIYTEVGFYYRVVRFEICFSNCLRTKMKS